MSIIRYNEPIYKRNFINPACNPGTEEVPSYKLVFSNDGGVALEQVGSKPLYKQIQANKVNCDLSSVLETCVHQNQLSVCSPDDITDAIADFTGLSTMSEWYAGMKNIERVWSDMPLDVREQFSSSKTAFINAIGSDDFDSKLNIGFKSYYDSIGKRLDKPTIPPFTNNPGTNNPGINNPGTNNSVTNNPGTNNPGINNPGTNNSGTTNIDGLPFQGEPVIKEV